MDEILLQLAIDAEPTIGKLSLWSKSQDKTQVQEMNCLDAIGLGVVCENSLWEFTMRADTRFIATSRLNDGIFEGGSNFTATGKCNLIEASLD